MRKRSTASSLVLTALPVALAACAARGPSDESATAQTTSVSTDCFTVSLADDFRYLDDHNLIVYAVGRQPYHVELSQTCIGLGADNTIALRSRTDRMCGFAGDSVIVDGGFAQRCSVLSVRRLDEDQFQLLVDQFERDGPEDSAIEVEVAELPEDAAEAEDSDAEAEEGGANTDSDVDIDGEPGD